MTDQHSTDRTDVATHLEERIRWARGVCELLAVSGDVEVPDQCAAAAAAAHLESCEARLPELYARHESIAPGHAEDDRNFGQPLSAIEHTSIVPGLKRALQIIAAEGTTYDDVKDHDEGFVRGAAFMLDKLRTKFEQLAGPAAAEYAERRDEQRDDTPSTLNRKFVLSEDEHTEASNLVERVKVLARLAVDECGVDHESVTVVLRTIEDTLDALEQILDNARLQS